MIYKRKEVIGNATLYLADCMDVLPTLGSVDAVITDIPYGVVSRHSNGLRDLDKKYGDLVTCGLSDIADILKLGQSVYVWCSTEQVSEIRAKLVADKFSTRLGFWEKTNPSPMNGQYIWLSAVECCVYGKRKGGYFSEFCKPPVWRGPIAKNQSHPTPKPVWLMQKQIVASVECGGTVLDPFAGSGTTGVACMNLQRQFIGIEREERYFDIACRRIDQAQRQGQLFGGEA